jgi:hypothetical protein
MKVFAATFFVFAACLVVRQAIVGVPSDAPPRLSAAWIARGLAAEAEGKFVEAEGALLEAARVDRQYLPAWTLANFYFRRENQNSFWPWAQRAAALRDHELPPLLKLCDLMDSRRVLDRLGDSPHLERAYLDFLIREGRLEDAQSAARRMLDRGDTADTARLLDLTDRQIYAGHGPAALEVWDQLAENRLIPFAPIDRRHPLTNGDLEVLPMGQGFDWRLLAAGEWRKPGLRFSFSEGTPSGLMEQFVFLDGPRWRLRFEYWTAGMPSPTGIRWALGANEGSPLLPAAAWRESESVWPVAAGLHRLILLYRREPGTIPARGQLEVRNMRLEVL